MNDAAVIRSNERRASFRSPRVAESISVRDLVERGAGRQAQARVNAVQCVPVLRDIRKN